jgi:hypothetical protein
MLSKEFVPYEYNDHPAKINVVIPTGFISISIAI